LATLAWKVPELSGGRRVNQMSAGGHTAAPGGRPEGHYWLTVAGLLPAAGHLLSGLCRVESGDLTDGRAVLA